MKMCVSNRKTLSAATTDDSMNNPMILTENRGNPVQLAWGEEWMTRICVIQRSHQSRNNPAAAQSAPLGKAANQ